MFEIDYYAYGAPQKKKHTHTNFSFSPPLAPTPGVETSRK